jgi:hypothetical protein
MPFMDSTFSLTISVHFVSFRRCLFYSYTTSNMVHTFHYKDKMPLVMPQNWVHLEWMDLAVPLWPTLLIIILYATGCQAFLNAAKLSYTVTVLPTTGHECPEGEQKYCFTPSLTSTLDGDPRSMARHSHLNPNTETQHSLDRRLGGLQGQSGQVQTITPPTRIQSQTVQPVASWLHPYIHKYEILWHWNSLPYITCLT